MRLTISAIMISAVGLPPPIIRKLIDVEQRHIDQITRAFDEIEAPINQALRTAKPVDLPMPAVRSLLTDQEDDCGLINGFGVSSRVLENICDFRREILQSANYSAIEGIRIKIS